MDIRSAMKSTFSLTRLPGESRSNGPFDEFAGLALIVSGIAYLYFDAIGGVVRFALPAMGLTMLAYSPAGLAIIALLCHFVSRIGNGEFTVPIVATLVFAVLEIILSFALGRTASEVGFALYIWLSFLVALAITQRRMQDRLIGAMIPIFFVATAGVLLNIMIDYPWVDASYEVLGRQMVAARDWQAYGMQRLSGFTRASYTAAAQILICYVALEHRTKSLPWRAAYWAIGLVAIFYTTSKSPLLAMACLPLVYFLVGRIRESDDARRRWAASGIMAFWVALVFAGPFLALTYGPQLYPAGTGAGADYSSFADRVLNTWPNAIAMIDRYNPVQWMFGRGLGSIGSPQQLAHPDNYNPGDNLAIYLFLTFGIASFVFAYLLFRGGQRAIDAGGRGRRDFVLIIAMLGIGTAANVIESIFPSMILAIACARPRNRRQPTRKMSAGSDRENASRPGMQDTPDAQPELRDKATARISDASIS